MINLSSYARLLLESRLTTAKLAFEFGQSLSQKLDTWVKPIKQRNYPSVPVFTHALFNVDFETEYKEVPLKIIVHLYHFKFPQSELEGLSDAEWKEMNRIAKTFSHIETTDDMLKNRNPLISIRATIMTNYNHDDKIEMDDIEPTTTQYVGKVEGKTIDETTTKIKQLLDDSLEDGDSLAGIEVS